MQSIFNRFITNEIINRFFQLFLLISLIWIVFLIIRLINFSQITSLKIIFTMSMLYLITASPIIIQVAMFIAILVTIIRSSLDNEMIIWLTSGFSLKNWFKPITKISIPISIIILILSFFISPLAYRKIYTISNMLSKENIQKNPSGRFIEFRDNNIIFFAEKHNRENQSFSNVFIKKVIEDGLLSIIVSEGLNFTISEDNILIDMNNVDSFNISYNTPGLNSTLYHFDNYHTFLNNKLNIKNSETKVLKCSTLIDLLNTKSLASMAHIVWRFSYFISSINLAFLSLPLAILNTRNSIFIKLFLSLLICFLYLSFINLVKHWIIFQNISLFFGLLTPHILIISINIFLMNQILDLNSCMRRNTNFL